MFNPRSLSTESECVSVDHIHAHKATRRSAKERASGDQRGVVEVKDILGLYEMCVNYGYPHSSFERREAIVANPPPTPDAVVDAVLAAEGFDPGGPVVASVDQTSPRLLPACVAVDGDDESRETRLRPFCIYRVYYSVCRPT